MHCIESFSVPIVGACPCRTALRFKTAGVPLRRDGLPKPEGTCITASNSGSVEPVIVCQDSWSSSRRVPFSLAPCCRCSKPSIPDCLCRRWQAARSGSRARNHPVCAPAGPFQRFPSTGRTMVGRRENQASHHKRPRGAPPLGASPLGRDRAAQLRSSAISAGADGLINPAPGANWSRISCAAAWLRRASSRIRNTACPVRATQRAVGLRAGGSARPVARRASRPASWASRGITRFSAANWAAASL